MKKKFVITAYLIILSIIIIFVLQHFFLNRSYKEILDYKETKEFSENVYDDSLFHQNEENFRIYGDEERDSIPGIDVSNHQGNIDWKKVRESGVKFAMIRLGFSHHENGEIFLDKKFQYNLKEADKNGIKTGVYFFSQAINTKEAIKEANFVLKNIFEYNIEMPVAFDMEEIQGGSRISNLSKEEKTKIADSFMYVINKGGYKAFLYGNPYWIKDNFNLEKLWKYDIWLAHYNKYTDFPYMFRMWQYSERGRVDGIKGPVDLDIYFLK